MKALTVFLKTFQVFNLERSLNSLSLFWYTLTAHFKPSKLTLRARTDWHNTPLFKKTLQLFEDFLHFYSKNKFVYLVMAFSHECLSEKMLIIYFPSGWFDLTCILFLVDSCQFLVKSIVLRLAQPVNAIAIVHVKKADSYCLLCDCHRTCRRRFHKPTAQNHQQQLMKFTFFISILPNNWQPSLETGLLKIESQ